GGNRGLKLEQPPSTIGVVTERSRAFDSLGDVRDNPVTPAPNLVAEQPKATRRACPDGTYGDDATFAALAPGRRLLDDEPSLSKAYLECRVVKVAAVAVLDPRRDPLEDPSVEADRVAAAPQRQPVEVDRARSDRRSHRQWMLAWSGILRLCGRARRDRETRHALGA